MDVGGGWQVVGESQSFNAFITPNAIEYSQIDG